MVYVSSRFKASCLVAGALLALAGCAGPPPEQAPPPPMATAEAPPAPSAPDLAGGPPESAPAAAPAAPDQTASMAPIPNPEDLNGAERARIYGHRYDREAAAAGAGEPVSHRVTRTTHVWGWRGRLAERRHTRRHAAHLLASLRPSLAARTAPKAAPKAASTTDRLTQLQASLAGPVADGSGFVVADDLANGKPGAVSLTLPADLYARLRNEAAKDGLAKDARRFDITATLSGDGYAFSPAPAQTLHASAAGAPAGAAPSFTWQAQPQPNGGGPLKVALVAQLAGATPETLPLLSLERPVKPLVTADQPAAGGPTAFSLHLGETDLPGLGKVPVSSILAVLVLILVVVVLVAAARHTAERDREERRRARAAARAALEAERASEATAYHGPEGERVVVHEPTVVHVEGDKAPEKV